MNVNLPLFNWDLNQYSTSIKIEIEEVDQLVTTVATDTRTVEFAANFEISGTIKKVGLKFGASYKTTQTQTIQKTYTQGNDELGGVIVNFADDIILSENYPYFQTRDYKAGWYTIGVEPKKVQ